MISVILPTYGASELETALNSVERQTVENLELVIIDDNPSGSLERKEIQETFDDYKDLSIQHIKREGKQGLGSARNRGIKEGGGELIAFLDDDDRWKPEKLSKQKKLLDKGFKACYTSRKVLRNGAVDLMESVDSPGLAEVLGQNVIGTPSSVMVEKEVLESVDSFDEEMDGAEEWDLWTRIIEQGTEFKSLKEPLTVYQANNNSLTESPETVTEGRDRYTEKHREKILRSNHVASQHFLTRSREQLELGNIENSRKYLKKAFKHSRRPLPVLRQYLNIRLKSTPKPFSRLRRPYCFG